MQAPPPHAKAAEISSMDNDQYPSRIKEELTPSPRRSRPDSPKKKSRGKLAPNGSSSRRAPRTSSGDDFGDGGAETLATGCSHRQRSLTKKSSNSNNARPLSTTLSATDIKARMKRRGSIDATAGATARRTSNSLDTGSSHRHHHHHHHRPPRRSSLSATLPQNTIAVPDPKSRNIVPNSNDTNCNMENTLVVGVIQDHTCLPAVASELLKNTHQQLEKNVAGIRDKVIKMQKKIADMEAEIAGVQTEMTFLTMLAPMTEEEKVNLLFDITDEDKGGMVDAGELSTAMRKNEKLSVSQSLDKAIDMVAKFDVDGNCELDREEFHAFVSDLAPTFQMTISDFCESMIVQMSIGKDGVEKEEENKMDKEKIRQKVKKRGELFAFINDKGMSESFVLH